MKSTPQSRRWFLLAVLVVSWQSASAQARWTVDTKSSLAWWQINPHMNHLWGTTCPQEPSWRPAEGRSTGWSFTQWLNTPVDGDLSTSDSLHVPLYPRYEARDICTEAVSGEVAAPDTIAWRGVRGAVVVNPNALVSGLDQRDRYTHDKILETQRYPEIRFGIDSLTDVTRHADTLGATAVGVLSLHGVDKVLRGRVRAWPEGGGLRVQGRFRIPAQAITREFGVSSFALGLGVGFKIWQDLFMGVDLLMHQQTPQGH